MCFCHMGKDSIPPWCGFDHCWMWIAVWNDSTLHTHSLCYTLIITHIWPCRMKTDSFFWKFQVYLRWPAQRPQALHGEAGCPDKEPRPWDWKDVQFSPPGLCWRHHRAAESPHGRWETDGKREKTRRAATRNVQSMWHVTQDIWQMGRLMRWLQLSVPSSVWWWVSRTTSVSRFLFSHKRTG